MMNLGHIVTGWSKSMGLMDVPDDHRKCSEQRMKICADCPNAKESSFLKLLKGKGHHMAAIYCNLCSCPVNEKSLVPKEYCPLGKWPGDQENKDFITNHKSQPNMKKTIALLLIAIMMAATSFAQNDPLSVNRQRSFATGYLPTYSTGGFKVLVKNNTTGNLEQTNYTVVDDTANGTFIIQGNGATGHALDLTTHIYHAWYWAKQNRAGGKTHLSDTTGTYYIDALSDSGILQLYPLSTKNKVYSISGKPGLTYGIGAKGNGYFRADDSGNTTKFIEIDPLVGVTSKDTLFTNQKFLSVRTSSGNTAITADTTQTTINSNKLRIGNATAPLIKSGSGSPLFVVSAPVGSLYLRTNGVADSTLYVKSVGVDSAGWYPAKH